MRMASAPPLVKAKPAPAQGVKRVAEEGTEDLEERTTAEPAAAPAAQPAEGSTEQAPPQDLRGVIPTRFKEVATDNIKILVEETYKRNNIEITEKEVSDIASLSCEMAATDIAEVYSPKRFTALAHQYKLRPGFAVDLCETQRQVENIGAWTSQRTWKNCSNLLIRMNPCWLQEVRLVTCFPSCKL